MQWLCLFSKVLLALVVVHAVFSVIAPIFEISIFTIDSLLQLLVFIATIKLFMQPKILYGIYLPIENIQQNSFRINQIMSVSTVGNAKSARDYLGVIIEKNVVYKKKIEDHFNQNVPFLNANYCLNDLVDEIHIPRHTISAFINQEYGVGFRKFINLKRVAYIIENFNQPQWQHLTLEAIANDAGFVNRSTFILNFKECTGQTPAAYFKNRC